MDLRSLFERVQNTAEGFKANCPKCGDVSQRFAFNEEKQVGCCFHAGCEFYYRRGGATLYALKALFARGDLTVVGAAPWVKEELLAGAVELPEGFRLLEKIQDQRLRESLLAYLESRHLNLPLLRLAEVGYCQYGPFWGYLVFPVYECGELVYWQARRFKKREPKFRNPKLQREGLLYTVVPNPNARTEAVVVESIFNALTLTPANSFHWTPFAVLGKPGVEHALRLRRFSRIQRVVVALDPDAWSEGLGFAETLLGYFPAVAVARFPKGEDVNSLGPAESWRRIFQAEPYDPRRRMELLHGKVPAR